MTQGSQSQRSATAGGIEGRGGFRREGTHVCLWPVHTDVLQNYHNIVIILQLFFLKKSSQKKKEKKSSKYIPRMRQNYLRHPE